MRACSRANRPLHPTRCFSATLSMAATAAASCVVGVQVVVEDERRENSGPTPKVGM